jgi:hypothetical protein
MPRKQRHHQWVSLFDLCSGTSRKVGWLIILRAFVFEPDEIAREFLRKPIGSRSILNNAGALSKRSFDENHVSKMLPFVQAGGSPSHRAQVVDAVDPRQSALPLYFLLFNLRYDRPGKKAC